MTHHSDARPLAGTRIGLSISESEDVAGLGFDSDETNRATREIALAILSHGGSLVFGHDWRADGVMASLFSFALDYRLPTLQDESAEPPIRNIVPWPSTSSVSRDERRRLKDVIDIQEVRPAGVTSTTETTLAQRVHSLTHMRQMLAEQADARIAIGGRVSGSGGRASGVVEEVLLSLQMDRPVYLSGLFGGATQQIIDVILGNDMGELSAFRTRPDVAEALGPDQQDGGFGIHPAMLADYPLARLSHVNGLSPDENRAMFEATQLNAVIGYMLRGLGRLKGQAAMA